MSDEQTEVKPRRRRRTSLSPKQLAILEAIQRSVASRGYPPSMREIGDAVGLASLSSVTHQLKQLELSGYLRRDPDAAPNDWASLSDDEREAWLAGRRPSRKATPDPAPGTAPSPAPADRPEPRQVRLVRLEIPRMEIGHRIVAAAPELLEQPKRQQPEVSPAREDEAAAGDLGRVHGEFAQLT